VNIIHLSPVDGEEPTPAELEAIEHDEWPLIAAELKLLDAEIAYINAGPAASDTDRRRIRRAARQVLKVARDLADRAPEAQDVA
jgi:hypothetical protein